MRTICGPEAPIVMVMVSLPSLTSTVVPPSLVLIVIFMRSTPYQAGVEPGRRRVVGYAPPVAWRCAISAPHLTARRINTFVRRQWISPSVALGSALRPNADCCQP